MVQRLNIIIALHQELAIHIDFVVANLHILYFEKGQQLISHNPTQAMEYFRASIRANNAFVPAMAAMAQVILNQGGNITESISWVRRAYAQRHRDHDTESVLSDISQNINNRLIAQARDFERTGNHLLSLRAWQEAAGFCSSIPSMVCSEQITLGISRAHHGIYTNLLESARQQLIGGNLELALQTAGNAVSYQQKNNEYIPSAIKAHSLIIDIRALQHKQLIDEGRLSLERQNYRNALILLEKALDIERNFPVDPFRQLGNLIKQAKRPILISELDLVQGAIQRNDTQKASELLSTVISDMQNYDFMTDRDILARYENLKVSLHGLRCKNIQNQIRQFLVLANQSILEGNFILADNFFNKIGEHELQAAECGISTRESDSLRFMVLPAINYQKAIQEVGQLIERRQYSQAVDRYNDAERLFYQHGLVHRGLQHQSLTQFSISFETEFIFHVANVMANLGEGSSALKLIYYLDAAGYQGREMRRLQEITGRVLARADIASNPEVNPRHKVLEYTQGDRNLKFLRNSYIRHFKNNR